MHTVSVFQLSRFFSVRMCHIDLNGLRSARRTERMGSGDIRSGHCHGWNINLGMHAQAHKPILPDGVSRYVLIYQGFAA